MDLENDPEWGLIQNIDYNKIINDNNWGISKEYVEEIVAVIKETNLIENLYLEKKRKKIIAEIEAAGIA